MKKVDYDKVKIGSIVRIEPKHSFNYNRLGKVVYQKDNYVVIEPLDGEPYFNSDRYTIPTKPILACNYAYLGLVE